MVAATRRRPRERAEAELRLLTWQAARRIAQHRAEPATVAMEQSYAAFIAGAWPIIEPTTPYLPNWHIDAIAAHMEAMCAGHIRNLLITMPPRLLKSISVAVLFPAWRWIAAPGERFIYASYSGDLATDHSLATRRVVESEWYQARWGHRVRLAPDQQLKTRFETTARGIRQATSVGGTATGRGGDWVICDDPLKVQDADSPAARAEANRWWDTVMSSRFNNPKTGRRIVVMQRLHEDDLAGHLIAQGGYVHLNLPMEYEPKVAHWTGFGEPDPRRHEGELLAPDHVGTAEVTELKLRLGTRAYSGQYQQHPAPAGGLMFKRENWRFYHLPHYPLGDVPLKMPDGSTLLIPCEPLPTFLPNQLQSWDCAFSDAKTSSYVAGQVWAVLGARRYLLDQTHAQIDFPATLTAIRSMSARWPLARRKLVENKANGPAVIATLKSELQGVKAVNPEGGKESRANAMLPAQEAGQYFLPHPMLAPWVEAFVEEFADFPAARHDDQVDAASQQHIETEAKAGSRTVTGNYMDDQEDDAA